jgi:hypothetical protein
VRPPWISAGFSSRMAGIDRFIAADRRVAVTAAAVSEFEFDQ